MDKYTATELAYKNGYEKGKPKWIPVSEMLPRDGARVLAYYDDGIIRLAINKGGFSDVVSHTYIKNNHHTVFAKLTHWMPLPEPPKEDE